MKPGLGERVLHGDEIVRSGDDLDAAVVVGDDVLGARIERRFHQLVLVGARREHDLAAMLEQERDRAVGAEVAAVFGERVPDVGDRARPVVGHAVDDHGGAVDAVALVADFLVVRRLRDRRRRA